MQSIILNLMSVLLFNMLFGCLKTCKLINVEDHLKTAAVEPDNALDL